MGRHKKGQLYRKIKWQQLSRFTSFETLPGTIRFWPSPRLMLAGPLLRLRQHCLLRCPQTQVGSPKGGRAARQTLRRDEGTHCELLAFLCLLFCLASSRSLSCWTGPQCALLRLPDHWMDGGEPQLGSIFCGQPMLPLWAMKRQEDQGHEREIDIYIYIYVVKFKSGPIFALFKVKKWSNFFVFFFVFIFQQSRSPCRKKRIFEKQAKKTTKKTQFLKLKSGPIMLRNIIGPLFNFNLDHFLTLEFCYFFWFFFLGGGLNPYFYSVFSKNAKLKETQKRKKTLLVNTTVLTALVKMSVFFFCIFHFCCFSNFHFFQRCFLTGFQKSKNNKIAKQEEQKTTTRKQDAKQK